MNLYRTTGEVASSRSLWRVIVLGTFVLATGSAQSTPPGTTAGTDSNSSVETLRKRIDELEAGQKQMQNTIDTLKGAVSNSTSTSGAPADTPTDASAADPSTHSHSLGPVQFQGFSDFDYGRAWFEKLPPSGLAGSPESFTIGDFDLFTNTRISERWSVLGEVLVTSDDTNAFSIELDRLLFTFRQSEYFKISAGKFNTALGYYTNAFHRAQYFQTGVGRPIMYSDEDNGGILPVHNVGVTATGKIPSGRLGLHWVTEIANGRSVASGAEPIQNFVDQNNGKAFNVAVYARPDWLPGLQFGFSAYRDTLHPSEIGAMGETILTTHIVYVGSRLEWLNEASTVRHVLNGENHVFDSLTAYSQVAWAFGKLRPFVRYDYQNVPNSEPIFGSAGEQLGRRSGPSIGLSRHISDYVALKVQYGRLGERGSTTTNSVTAQLAFAF